MLDKTMEASLHFLYYTDEDLCDLDRNMFLLQTDLSSDIIYPLVDMCVCL